MTVEISSCVVQLIHQAAADAAPNEACGLLFGTNCRIERASLVENVAADPRGFFEIDPAALFAALRNERSGGEALLGYWHSHPNGRAEPSATDAAMAVPDGRLWLIAAGNELTAWRLNVNAAFDAVPLIVR